MKTSPITLRGTRGATLVEYGLLLALILVVAAGAYTTLGTDVNTAGQNAGSKFQAK